MNTQTKDRSRVSAHQKNRQNWVTSLMLVTALAFMAALLFSSSEAAAQTPAAPDATPPALRTAIVEAEMEMGIPPGPTPVPAGQCNAPSGMRCYEFDLGGSTYEVPAPEGVTQMQLDAAITAADCRITERQRVLARAVIRVTRRVQAGEVSESALLGLPANASTEQRIAAAHTWGTYLRETVQAEFSRLEAQAEAGDATLRLEAQAATASLRAHFDGEVRRLDGRIDAERERATGVEGPLRADLNAEVARATAAEQRINARLDRHTLGVAFALEGAFLRDNPMYGATVRGYWRTGSFFLQVDMGGLYNAGLAAGTFVGGGGAGGTIDAGSGSVDLGAYARTMQLPEDRVGSRSGRVVQSAGALMFEGGIVGRYRSARRGPGFLAELRLGLADPPGDDGIGLVIGAGAGFSWNFGL